MNRLLISILLLTILIIASNMMVTPSIDTAKEQESVKEVFSELSTGFESMYSSDQIKFHLTFKEIPAHSLASCSYVDNKIRIFINSNELKNITKNHIKSLLIHEMDTCTKKLLQFSKTQSEIEGHTSAYAEQLLNQGS